MTKLKKYFALSLILTALFSVVGFAIDIPKPTTQFYANDFASVLTQDTENFIISSSAELQKKTGAQIVVTTVSDLGGNALEDYSLNMLRTYGIGDSKKNNGVLILLAIKERKSRIEVGYGLEGALPDGKTGRIQDEYMIPYYKDGKYDEGIKNGYKAVLQEVYKEYSTQPTSSLPKPTTKSTNPLNSIPSPLKIIGIIIGIIILLIDWIFLGGAITRTLFWIVIAFGRGGGRGGGFGGGGGYSGGGGSGGGGGSSRGF